MRIFSIGAALIAAAAGASAVQGTIITRCVKNGLFAMTFDDGPAQYTNQLLDILDAQNVKVTFHFTTAYLTDPAVQATIRRAAAAGHLIGLRSEPAWNLASMDSDTITSEVQRVASVMQQFSGTKPQFIRLPYGTSDPRILSAVAAGGMAITQGNMDSYDSTTADSSRIYSAFQLALALYAPGQGNFISVQHDGVSGSVAATPKIIDLIASKNYNIVRLDACVGSAAIPTASVISGGSNGGSSTQTSNLVGTYTSTSQATGTVGGKTATGGAEVVSFALVQLVLGAIAASLFAL